MEKTTACTAVLALVTLLIPSCGGTDADPGLATVATFVETATSTTGVVTTSIATSTTGSPGSFDNPVRTGYSLGISGDQGEAISVAVSPLEDGDQVMEAFAEKCVGSGCPENAIEEGQRWVILPVYVANVGDVPVDVGMLLFSVFGDEGVERPGQALCGERGETQFATVLPGGHLDYVRCFAVSSDDLKSGPVKVSVTGLMDGLGGKFWLQTSSAKLVR